MPHVCARTHVSARLFPAMSAAAAAFAASQVRDPDSKTFLMFYEAVAEDGSRSVGLATSEDGRGGWVRASQPVLTAAPGGSGAWDGGSVGSPCAVPMAAGRWRVYYAGRERQAGPWRGIGLALGTLERSAEGQFQLVLRRRTGSKGGAETEAPR